MIRSFVGLEIPEDIGRMLVAAQSGLRLGRLVDRENMHITLAFLGEHPRPVIEDVHHALSAIRSETLEVTLAGLGVFGGASPRVLYADVAAAPGLSSLRKKVKRAASDAGVTLAHERYQPHVTLARFGQGLTGPDALDLQGFLSARMTRVAGQFTAHGFALFESRLGRQGASYEILADYPLALPTPEEVSASKPSVLGSNS